MRILHEDRDIIVAVKPRGILSQSDKSGEKSLCEQIEEYLKECGKNASVYVVHRLDRGVSGVMVYALTKKAAASLSAQIQSGEFKKEYVALVHSAPENSEGTMEDLLFKDASKNKTYVVKRMRKGVKPASLSYKLVRTFQSKYGEVSLVNIFLHTGRTHQIRVQFASRKMPLVGDGKYGAADNAPEIGLFCSRISFLHPFSGERLSFEAKPDFCSAE